MLRAGRAIVIIVLASGCAPDDAEPPGPSGFSGSGSGATGGVGGDAGAAGGAGGSGTTGGSGGVSDVLCKVAYRWKPPAGTTAATVALAGEWNAFDPKANPLAGPDSSGSFTATVQIAPGFWGYKLLKDGAEWLLDDDQGYRKYLGGEENSALRVADCTVPAFVVDSTSYTRPAGGSGAATLELRWVAAVSGDAVDAASVTATLRHHGDETPVAATSLGIDVTTGRVTLSLTALEDGKYTVVLSAKDAAGVASRPLEAPFWIEQEPFDWRDALVYMVMTDRFENGDPSNDAPATPGVTDTRADWKGGDLEGLRTRIADGTFDALGVRALWLSPFQTNPSGAYLASDGQHQVAGYHGYWPIRARDVDARLGGEAALRSAVAEAHRHGIRVLMDFVVNHVHEEHEYFAAHPDWFRTGCVCGTTGCDWTDKRLECLFADYMPDVNWTVTEASEQLTADAVWWLDEFDLDGLRVDAVKHVEDAAVRNLATRVRETLEIAGNHYFLMGETAMGWSDCGIACNADQYGTIARYVGPHGLDGQFDFVLYHAVPYNVFAYDDFGLIHADFWTNASQSQYPAGSIMTPYIGSHDSTRFVTLASYRGQPGFARDVPTHQWSDLAGAPPDAEPYARHALALSWLLGLPGAPLLYYGDEYGEWGGADPGNRAGWRGAGTLSGDEQAVLLHAQRLGQARRELVALRRGDYQTLQVSETFLAFARQAGQSYAIVALSSDTAASTTSVALPASLQVPDGTQFDDRLGGPSLTVSGGAVQVALPARGAAVLAP